MRTKPVFAEIFSNLNAIIINWLGLTILRRFVVNFNTQKDCYMLYMQYASSSNAHDFITYSLMLGIYRYVFILLMFKLELSLHARPKTEQSPPKSLSYFYYCKRYTALTSTKVMGLRHPIHTQTILYREEKSSYGCKLTNKSTELKIRSFLAIILCIDCF